MKTPKAYFIDIDGTLTKGHKNQTLSYNNIRSMKAAAREGSFVVLSSGRSPRDMKVVWDQFQINNEFTSWIVSNNGASIENFQKGKIFFEEGIREHTYIKLSKYLWEKGYIFKNSGKSEYFLNPKRKLFNFISKKFITINNNFDDFLFSTVNSRKIGVLTSFSKAKVNRIAKKIRQNFKGTEVVISGPGLYIEINAKRVSKGKAIRILCKEWGISPKDTVHIGDSLNDASGFEVAGIGVSMKNSMKKLKKLSDFSTASMKNDGVSKAIDSLRTKE